MEQGTRDVSVPTHTESRNNQQQNKSLQISEKSTRGIRKKYKNLRKGDGSHILVPSTQDFSVLAVTVLIQ